jgi:hypothetical protein
MFVVLGLVGPHLSLGQEAPIPPEVPSPVEADEPEAVREDIDDARGQLEAARQAMREAERKVKEAGKQMREAAQAQNFHIQPLQTHLDDRKDQKKGFLGGYEFDWDQFLGNIPFLRRRLQERGGHRVLVIPAGKIAPKELLTTMEDMTIMSRIIAKKLSEEDLIPEVRHEGYGGGYGGHRGGYGGYGRGGYSRTACPWHSSDAIEAIYLDGYGALIVIDVDFPLSAPLEKKRQEDTEEPGDEVWEETKQEIYSPEDHDDEHTDAEEEFDEDKVEEIQEELLRTLKHAANIRNVKQDEVITLTVVGRGELRLAGVNVVATENQLIVEDKHTKTVRVYTKDFPGSPPLPGMGVSSATVLTMRVEKTDVDAFASGELDFDGFRQKVQIILY